METSFSPFRILFINLLEELESEAVFFRVTLSLKCE